MSNLLFDTKIEEILPKKAKIGKFVEFQCFCNVLDYTTRFFSHVKIGKMKKNNDKKPLL